MIISQVKNSLYMRYVFHAMFDSARFATSSSASLMLDSVAAAAAAAVTFSFVLCCHLGVHTM